MSTNLYWKPITTATETLADELKYVLRKSWGWPIDRIVDSHDTAYFTGLRDAGIEGSQAVLDLIDKHETIHLQEK